MLGGCGGHNSVAEKFVRALAKSDLMRYIGNGAGVIPISIGNWPVVGRALLRPN